MTPPSIEEPDPGSCCPDCGCPIRVVQFCPDCYERSMQERERTVEGQLEETRERARTWQLGRAVRQ